MNSNDDKLVLGEKIELMTEKGSFFFRYAALNGKEALIVEKNINEEKSIVLRIQSSCVLSETFHTIDCDCSDQLSFSLDLISKTNGIVIYEYDEGRGIGLANKLKALIVQKEKKEDTAQAFKYLGFESDERNFKLPVEILKKLFSGYAIDIITDNKKKVDALRESGLIVRNIIPCVRCKNDIVRKYLAEKRDALGHSLGKNIEINVQVNMKN